MFSVEEADSASLVSETDRNLFSEGLARYYSHVTGLFEKAKAPSFVADFARLGLRSLTDHEDDELKTDILQRLFTACMQTARYAESYSVIPRLNNYAL